MPIYEYKCTKCEHRLEKLQKMADDPLKDCPQCGKSSLIKLVSASKFKLKGTGWYETDFKGSKKEPEKKGNSEKSEPSQSTKSEKTPAKTTSASDKS